MIEFRDVTFTYAKGKGGVKNINLNIKKGELIVLTGKSGSGKTTVTRLINGLAGSFYEGKVSNKIYVNKFESSHLSMWEKGKVIGSVFQDPRSQFFSTEVEGEIAYGCENYGYKTKKIQNRVNRAINDLEICNLKGKKLLDLSNGEKQKVAIASVYAVSPEIYVFDEPSSNLDIKSTKQLGLLIKYLKECGKTIIVSEHRIWYLINIADRFIHMEKGKIAQINNRKEMLAKTTDMLRSQGIRSMVKPSINKNLIHNNMKKSKDILKVTNLSFFYGKKDIFSSLSFSIKEGEIVAITGENGAGKTTLARILCGLIKQKTGEILIANKIANKKSRMKKIRYIPHDTDSQLFGESVLNEILLTIEDNDYNSRKAFELIDKMNLKESINKHPSTLSGGQKQRLVLASALMEKRKILIFDEPTSGLDAENMYMVAETMKNIVSRGITILIITHDTEMIEACCDRCIELI